MWGGWRGCGLKLISRKEKYPDKSVDRVEREYAMRRQVYGLGSFGTYLSFQARRWAAFQWLQNWAKVRQVGRTDDLQAVKRYMQAWKSNCNKQTQCQDNKE